MKVFSWIYLGAAVIIAFGYLLATYLHNHGRVSAATVRLWMWIMAAFFAVGLIFGIVSIVS